MEISIFAEIFLKIGGEVVESTEVFIWILPKTLKCDSQKYTTVSSIHGPGSVVHLLESEVWRVQRKIASKTGGSW